MKKESGQITNYIMIGVFLLIIACTVLLAWGIFALFGLLFRKSKIIFLIVVAGTVLYALVHGILSIRHQKRKSEPIETVIEDTETDVYETEE